MKIKKDVLGTFGQSFLHDFLICFFFCKLPLTEKLEEEVRVVDASFFVSLQMLNSCLAF
jgi:hypothetical protein